MKVKLLIVFLVLISTSVFANFFSEVFTCSICGGTFKNREYPISCTVFHPPGTCCHYGQDKIEGVIYMENIPVVTKESTGLPHKMDMPMADRHHLDWAQEMTEKYNQLIDYLEKKGD